MASTATPCTNWTQTPLPLFVAEWGVKLYGLPGWRDRKIEPSVFSGCPTFCGWAALLFSSVQEFEVPSWAVNKSATAA